MGLGYDDLAAAHPRLIYACTSGYGLQGDEAERPAFDPVGQARAGMFYAGGAPGDPPNWLSYGFADIMGASMLAYGVVAAVAARERHGMGQLVEASHLQASMWLEFWGIGAGLYKGLSDWPRFDRETAGNPSSTTTRRPTASGSRSASWTPPATGRTSARRWICRI